MTTRMTRITAAVTGLALAATVAMPVLATAGAPASPVTADPSADTGLTRCLTEWIAVQTDRTLANVKAAGDCEIDRRLDTIDNLEAAVGQADVLTAAHEAALRKILADSRTGLTGLRTELDGDTTLAEAAADVRRIFTDYRIYVLVGRQVALVTADDRVGAVSDELDAAATQLQAAIDAAKANGRDITAAQAHLDAMTAAITSARGQVAGDADGVLAQTAATWNAGSSKPVLDAARASISAARSDLRTAAREARATLAALR
jgi:hypothetical protein